MERSDAEELYPKCGYCASGLTLMEITLYGNRCVFCAPQAIKISFLHAIRNLYYDWRIYQLKLQLQKIPDGKVYYLGALGVVGYVDSNQLNTWEKKREFIKIMENILRTMRHEA